MILSWASLYGYLSARTTAKVERVVFLVDVVNLSLQMSINGGDPNAAPLKYVEVAPLIEGFLPALGVPSDADVQHGTVDIDYRNNAAEVTAYYLHDGHKQRRAQRYKF